MLISFMVDDVLDPDISIMSDDALALGVNIIPDDALAPSGARATTGMILT